MRCFSGVICIWQMDIVLSFWQVVFTYKPQKVLLFDHFVFSKKSVYGSRALCLLAAPFFQAEKTIQFLEIIPRNQQGGIDWILPANHTIRIIDL